MKVAFNAVTQMPATEPWKQALGQAITSPLALVQALGVSRQLADRIIQQPDFKCLVTHSYLNKIQPGNPDDPLLR